MKTPKSLYLVHNGNNDENETFTNSKDARQFYNTAREDCEFWGEDRKKISLITYSRNASKKK